MGTSNKAPHMVDEEPIQSQFMKILLLHKSLMMTSMLRHPGFGYRIILLLGISGVQGPCHGLPNRRVRLTPDRTPNPNNQDSQVGHQITRIRHHVRHLLFLIIA